MATHNLLVSRDLNVSLCGERYGGDVALSLERTSQNTIVRALSRYAPSQHDKTLKMTQLERVWVRRGAHLIVYDASLFAPNVRVILDEGARLTMISPLASHSVRVQFGERAQCVATSAWLVGVLEGELSRSVRMRGLTVAQHFALTLRDDVTLSLDAPYTAARHSHLSHEEHCDVEVRLSGSGAMVARVTCTSCDGACVAQHWERAVIPQLRRRTGPHFRVPTHAEGGDEECKICYDRVASVEFASCVHRMCLECARRCSTRARECPFCRQPVSHARALQLVSST